MSKLEEIIIDLQNIEKYDKHWEDLYEKYKRENPKMRAFELSQKTMNELRRTGWSTLYDNIVSKYKPFFDGAGVYFDDYESASLKDFLKIFITLYNRMHGE